MKDFWNTRYLEEGFAYGKNPNDFLKQEYLKFPVGAKILCLSEGEGRNAIFLSTKGFDVTAVDLSDVGMKKASEWAQSLHLDLKTIVADLNDFEMGEKKWDVIVSIFGHLPKHIRQKVHLNIQKALKDNGLFLLEAYTPEQLQFGTGGPKDESMMMTEEIINNELSFLKPMIKKKLVREIHEGKYHNGQSAVIQFLGQKTSK